MCQIQLIDLLMYNTHNVLFTPNLGQLESKRLTEKMFAFLCVIITSHHGDNNKSRKARAPVKIMPSNVNISTRKKDKLNEYIYCIGNLHTNAKFSNIHILDKKKSFENLIATIS